MLKVDNLIFKYSEFFGLDLPYFIKGGFWITLSLIVTTIGGLFLSSLFARIWPPDVYGQYSFLMAAISFVTFTSLPGMSSAVTQAVAEGKEGIYKKVSKLVFKWSLIGTTILLIGSIYFFLRHNSNLAFATFFSATAFSITVSFSFYNSYLNGKKQFKKVAIFSTISQFSSILATAFAIWKLPSLYWVALFSAWSTATVNFILTYITIKELKNNDQDDSALKLGKHLSFSQILIGGSEYLDRFLVPLLLGFSNNAIYAFAILAPMQLHNYLKMFLMLGQPKIAEINNGQLFKDLLKKTLQLEIVVVLIVATYITLAPYFFNVLFSTYKDSAVNLSQIFALSLLYYPSNLFGLALIKQRNTKSIIKINTIYSTASIFSLLIFIPLFGLLGAVYAKILSRFVYSFFQIYYFQRSSKLKVATTT
jgi:O-antigen/teichoic acid export membrane protein